MASASLRSHAPTEGGGATPGNERRPALTRSIANEETRVTATSFDSRLAPVARGFFLGDYVGLDNIGNVFTPLFTQTYTDPASEQYAEVGP